MLYFQGSRLVVEDYMRRRRFAINEDALLLLRLFDRWLTLKDAVGHLPGYDPGSVVRSAERLRRKGLLVVEGTSVAERHEALRQWRGWDHAGTYFHFSTRANRFARTAKELDRVVARVTRTRMPEIFKDATGPRLPLPKPSAELCPGSLGRALLSRRTCREFLLRPVSIQRVETVTVMTFGRLGLIDGGPFGTLLHRASPSGGGRHPIECYLLARNVRGLSRGLYHYSVRENALVKLKSGLSRQQLSEFMHGQEWFADAPALFVLTAVFARTMWKYPHPRAYRVLQIDAAHACQNLLLIATSLGLGAYSVAALDEEKIDRYLEIDGIQEGSIYMAGIGWPDRRRIRAGIRGGLLPGGPVPRSWAN